MNKLMALLSFMAILIMPAASAASVYISAINFDAPGNDNYNPNGEWVKITNQGNEAVDMTGWTISDEGNKHVYMIPYFVLHPGATVTVYTGSGVNSYIELYMGFGKAIWNNDGDTCTLKDKNGNIIDTKSNRY